MFKRFVRLDPPRYSCAQPIILMSVSLSNFSRIHCTIVSNMHAWQNCCSPAFASSYVMVIVPPMKSVNVKDVPRVSSR